MALDSVLALTPVLPNFAAAPGKDTDQECQSCQKPTKAGSKHTPVPAIGPQRHGEDTGNEENEGYNTPCHSLLDSVGATALRVTPRSFATAQPSSTRPSAQIVGVQVSMWLGRFGMAMAVWTNESGLLQQERVMKDRVRVTVGSDGAIFQDDAAVRDTFKRVQVMGGSDHSAGARIHGS